MAFPRPIRPSHVRVVSAIAVLTMSAALTACATGPRPSFDVDQPALEPSGDPAIDAVLDRLEFPGTDPVVRERLEDELVAVGPGALHQRLVHLVREVVSGAFVLGVRVGGDVVALAGPAKGLRVAERGGEQDGDGGREGQQASGVGSPRSCRLLMRNISRITTHISRAKNRHPNPTAGPGFGASSLSGGMRMLCPSSIRSLLSARLPLTRT